MAKQAPQLWDLAKMVPVVLNFGNIASMVLGLSNLAILVLVTTLGNVQLQPLIFWIFTSLVLVII